MLWRYNKWRFLQKLFLSTSDSKMQREYVFSTHSVRCIFQYFSVIANPNRKTFKANVNGLLVWWSALRSLMYLRLPFPICRYKISHILETHPGPGILGKSLVYALRLHKMHSQPRFCSRLFLTPVSFHHRRFENLLTCGKSNVVEDKTEFSRSDLR